jgi:glycosyltransferase involved in cell wall biosynthesis
MAGPQIDIIIPVYNHADHLERCIRSAAAQTFAAQRIICVDDASPDPRVKEILSELAAQLPTVEVITLEKNGGICHAQNVAVAAATAEYIAFLDCDDWLVPDALMSVADALKQTPAGYVFTDRIDINEEAGEERARPYGGQPQLRETRTHAENLLDHMVASHLKVIRKELIDRVGGFAEGTDGVQDWDVALKVSEIAPLLHVPKAVYYHRVHSGQNSSYDNVVNMRKTNEVRRAAQLRRFNASLHAGRDFRLPAMIEKLRQGASDFFSTLSSTHVILALDSKGKIQFVPQHRDCVRQLINAHAPSELLLFGTDNLYLPMLQDIWASQSRPAIGVYLAEFEGIPRGIHSLRWSNSYLDYVVCGSSEGHISLLGYTHRALKMYVPSPPRIAEETANDARAVGI